MSDENKNKKITYAVRLDSRESILPVAEAFRSTERKTEDLVLCAMYSTISGEEKLIRLDAVVHALEDLANGEKTVLEILGSLKEQHFVEQFAGTGLAQVFVTTASGIDRVGRLTIDGWDDDFRSRVWETINDGQRDSTSIAANLSVGVVFVTHILGAFESNNRILLSTDTSGTKILEVVSE